MVRLPTKEELGKPVNLTPRGGISQIAVPNASGIGIGGAIADLGRGITSAAASLKARQDEGNAIDLVRADSQAKIRKMELGQDLQNDNDYSTWGNRYEEGAKKIDDEAASLIRDPVRREKFLLQSSVDTAAGKDRLFIEANNRDKIIKKVELVKALDNTREIRLNPNATPEQKAQAASDAAAYITALGQTVQLTAAEQVTLNNRYGKGVLKEDAEAQRAKDPEGFDRKFNFRPKAAIIMPRLMQQFGLSEEDAAAILGNFGHETGGFNYYAEIDPIAGPGGRGWAQWTGPRREAFLAWAQANGLDPASDEASWGYFLVDPETPAAIEAVKNAGTLQEKVVAFENAYERSGVKAYGSRQQYTLDALDSMRDGGDEFADLDPADRTDLAVKAAQSQADRMKVGSPYEAAERFADRGRPLNPLDDDEKKRMNAWVASTDGANLILGLDQGYLDSAVVPFVEQWGAVPGDIKGAFEGLLRSPDPRNISFALDGMDKLERANPRAFARDMTAENVGLLADYRSRLRFAPNKEEVAQQILSEQADPAKAEARKAKRAEGEGEAKKIVPYLGGYFASEWATWAAAGVHQKTAESFASVFGPELPDGPERAEFEQEFINGYSEALAKTGGDHSKALDLYLPVFKKRWGPSAVNGGRIMRNPPEAFNPDGIDSVWMQRQARARLFPLIGDSPFKIVSDDRTDTEIAGGSPPTYQVFVPSGA